MCRENTLALGDFEEFLRATHFPQIIQSTLMALTTIHVVGDIFCDIVARVPSSEGVPARWGDDVLAESIAILPGGTAGVWW